jgi:single-stranded-DNA-specific exonuclease
LPNHVLLSADEVGTGHLRLRVRASDGSTTNAIAFRTVDQPLGVALRRLRGQPIHLAGCLQLDEWGGRSNVGFRLIDAAETSETA